jgi:HEAT repeat protein
VTVLGTDVLRRARVAVRGTLDKVTHVGVGVEVATVGVAETLWGTPPEGKRIRILSNEAGYFSRVAPEAIFFLEPLEPGDRYTCRAVIDGTGEEGAARLAAVRRSLDIERRPREERAAALRASCFESLGAPDAWTRRNAGREIAHLSGLRPGAFTAADLRDLRRAALRERDTALRPSLVAAVESLSRAAAEDRLAPPDAGAVTLRGAPLLRRLREDPDPKARRQAAEAAGREGEAGEAALVESVEKDADAGVRAAAAEALGSAGSAARSGPALLRRAKEDADPLVRAAAVESLGLLGAADAVGALGDLARGDAALARGALFALARIRTDGALEVLRALRAEAADGKAPGAAASRDLVDFLLSADFVKQEESLKKVRAASEK